MVYKFNTPVNNVTPIPSLIPPPLRINRHQNLAQERWELEIGTDLSKLVKMDSELSALTIAPTGAKGFHELSGS